jgi:hypothetical protein
MRELPLWAWSANPDSLLIFFLFCFRLHKLLAVNEKEYFTELQLKEEVL